MAKKNIITAKSQKFLEAYLNNASPTGFETEGQKLWLDYIKPYIDTHIVDTYGTVVGVVNPDAPYKVVIEAHADEISWFVEDRLRKRNKAAGLINPPRQIENLEIQEEEQDIPSAEEIVVQKPVQPEDKVRYWMSFYTDGTWSFDTRP